MLAWTHSPRNPMGLWLERRDGRAPPEWQHWRAVESYGWGDDEWERCEPVQDCYPMPAIDDVAVSDSR